MAEGNPAIYQHAMNQMFSAEAAKWDTKPMIRHIAESTAKVLKAKGMLTSSTTAMELGCGTGLLSSLLINDVASIAGIDPAEGMIEKYNERAKELGKESVMQGHCLALKEKNDPRVGAPAGRFALIFSSMTFHHIEDTQGMIALLVSYLKSGGVLAVVDLRQTADSHKFHGHSKHHFVHHHGGIDGDWIAAKFAEAGLTDVKVEPVCTISKVPEGEDTEREFEILLATGTKPVVNLV